MPRADTAASAHLAATFLVECSLPQAPHAVLAALLLSRSLSPGEPSRSLGCRIAPSCTMDFAALACADSATTASAILVVDTAIPGCTVPFTILTAGGIPVLPMTTTTSM